MKTLVTLGVVIAVVCAMSAQSMPVMTPSEPKPVAQASAKKTAAKPEKKIEEPKIPGTSVTRADGTYVGLEVVSGNFKLSFYDKKKKLMSPTVTRAAARWPNPRSPGDNRTVLNLSGNALIGAKPVIPPFVFNVYLTLLEGEGEAAKAVESFVIPFRG